MTNKMSNWDNFNDADISRRSLLKLTAAGLITGASAPLLFHSSSVMAAEKRDGKILIAYYSRTNTTRDVASQIHQLVGGDLFELQTVHSYPREYRATTHQAKQELESGFRPQLTAEVPNLSSYDFVFIGFPNWWGTLPVAFFTFLEQHNFASKTLIPFCTHEGSQFGRSIDDIKHMCPNATLLEGLALRGGGISNVQTDSARQSVSSWMRRINMIA